MNCLTCAIALVPHPGKGRPPLYCSKKCRTKEYHRRLVAARGQAVLNAEARAWHEANPEKQREYAARWRESHREQARATSRAYYLEHREAILPKHRIYRKANPEVFRAGLRRYNAAHPDLVAQRNAGRRGAVIRGQPVLIREVFDRCASKCHICRKAVDWECKWPDPLSKSLDHLIPISKGGSHEPANVSLAHYGCNSSRNDGRIAAQLWLIPC